MYNSYLNKYYENNKINFNEIDNINVDKFASFIHTVNLWSQILGFLLFQCDEHKKRKNIVKNLYDENNGEYTHVETFYMFLNELGYKNNINDIPLEPYVELYNKLLLNIIKNNTFDNNCQILGSIEYIYHKISTDLVNWYRLKYNKYPDNHFTLHETLDISHSKELFDLSDNDIDENNLVCGADWILDIIKSII
jgi:pyrroloquinoline quinone (PQQ) biosynthesis protein C